MYHADTMAQEVWAYDVLDVDGGILGERRTFARVEAPRGGPDGAATDTDGCYWSAVYGAGKVVRLTPDGRVEREVQLPVPNVTMIAFGGADLRTAYVTSSAKTVRRARRCSDRAARGRAVRVRGAGAGRRGAAARRRVFQLARASKSATGTAIMLTTSASSMPISSASGCSSLPLCRLSSSRGHLPSCSVSVAHEPPRSHVVLCGVPSLRRICGAAAGSISRMRRSTSSTRRCERLRLHAGA